MRTSKANFYLSPRPRKNGRPIYYVRIPIGDNREKTLSTGLTIRSKAERKAQELYDDFIASQNTVIVPTSEIETLHQIIAEQKARIEALENPSNDTPLFSDYAKDYYCIDSPWYKRQLIEKGRISKTWCQNKQYILDSKIIPLLEGKTISDIATSDIEHIKSTLFDQHYSGNTINKTLSALKTILENAVDDGFLIQMPKFVKAKEQKKEKDILTLEEVDHLFSIDWYDIRCKIANITAAQTGIRLGELQALTLNDLDLDKKTIRIWRSWNNQRHEFNKTTKTGKERIIWLNDKVYDAIITLLSIHPYSDNSHAFLFFGNATGSQDFTPNRPLGVKAITGGLYQALSDIGINEKMRKERNVTFHSWRHFLNTHLIASGTPLAQVQQITGHSSERMSNSTYFHTTSEGNKQLTATIDQIFEV